MALLKNLRGEKYYNYIFIKSKLPKMVLLYFNNYYYYYYYYKDGDKLARELRNLGFKNLIIGMSGNEYIIIIIIIIIIITIIIRF